MRNIIALSRKTERVAVLCFACFVFSLITQVQSALTAFPKPLQLYCRDAQDSAVVAITGTIITTGPESVTVTLYKNNMQTLHLVQRLQYSGGTASFSFLPKIHAELSMYKFELYIDTSLYTSADSVVCGDAFIIDGQSNSIGGNSSNASNPWEYCNDISNPWIRSFGRMRQFLIDNGLDCSKTETSDSTWGLPVGAKSIGGFGRQVAVRIVENQHIPVAVINDGQGGTSIVVHERDLSYCSIYGHLYSRVILAGFKNSIKAVFWHQGEFDPGNTNYKAEFLSLHNFWKTDFPGLQYFYLFQIRPGCGGDLGLLREQQRQIPQGNPDISIMSTVHIPHHDGCHYFNPWPSDGYRIMGDCLYRQVARDLYASTDTVGINPPDIIEARFLNMEKTQILLCFTQGVLLPPDTLGHSIREAFAIGNRFNVVDSVKADTVLHAITLFLPSTMDSSSVSYVPDNYVYQGPWLKNSNGIGALTFYRFPVLESGTRLLVTLRDSVTKQIITTLASVRIIKSGIAFDSVKFNTGAVNFFMDTGSYAIDISAAGYIPQSGIPIRLSGNDTTLTVHAGRQVCIGIDIQSDSMYMPFSSTLPLNLYGIYPDGTRLPLLPNSPLPTWISRSPELISVSDSGLLKSNSINGRCFIVANITSLGFSDSSLVRVVSLYQQPLYLWLLNEISGYTASEASGNGNTAALHGDPAWGAGKYGNALTFDGADDYLSTSLLQTNPDVFTLSLWFKTTSTTGGKLIGFGDAQTGLSGHYDRHLYMDNAGKIYFGCYNGSVQTISAALACNDNAWHYAAATLSGAGMMLYVDGVLAESKTNVTSGENYSGYWRMGFDNLTGWTNPPSSKYFSGQLDDIRVYDKALSASDIASLYGNGTENEPVIITPENLDLAVSPNPFNPSAHISYCLPQKSVVSLALYSLQGKLVRKLVDGQVSAGRHTVQVDAGSLASGIYICELKTNAAAKRFKLVLMR